MLLLKLEISHGKWFHLKRIVSCSYEDKEAIATFPHGRGSEGRVRRPYCTQRYGRHCNAGSVRWKGSSHSHWTYR